MNDLERRIVVSIESAEAERKISAIKKNIGGVVDKQQQHLQLTKLQTSADKEQFHLEQVSHNLRKAEAELLDALYQRRRARKQGAETNELTTYNEAVSKAKKRVIDLTDAHAASELKVYRAKQAIDNFGKSAENSSKSAKKLSWSQLGVRSAARALKMELGEGTNPNLAKIGIIAAGAASAMKILQFALTRTAERMRYQAEIARANTDSMQSVIDRNNELRDEQNKTLDSISRLNEKERLSNADKLDMLKLVTALEKGYNKYGIAIDAATGKITNLQEVQGKIAEEQRVKRLKEIELKQKELKEERKQQKELVDNMAAGFRKVTRRSWFGLGAESEQTVFFFPTQNDITKGETASKRLKEISEEQSKLVEERLKLMKQTPLADAEKLENALLKDKQDKYTQEIKLNEHRLQIQNLRNQGLMKEAKLAEINYKLDQERMNLAGKEVAVFDKNRKARAAAEFALWEAQQTKKEKKENAADYKDLSAFYRDMNQYRATTQGAIVSGSVEAMRLRSRQMVNTSADNPAAATAKNTQKQAELLMQIADKTNEMINKLNQITGSGVKIQNLAVRSL